MQTPQRQREPGLIGRLFAEPWRFGLMPAVTLLVRWLGRRGISSEEALAQVLRFENSVSLAFPSGEIEALRAEDTPQGPRIVMTTACFGLLGTAGTLPLHDTDRYAHAVAAREEGGRAFIDCCSTRMVALFWRAWAMHRQELARETQGHDGWRPRLQALGGNREAGGDTSAWYAGLLRIRPISCATLQNILAGELGAPVRVESLVGAWENIPAERRSKLGKPGCAFGAGATLGGRKWRIDRRLRIVIGPLDRAGLDWLLPRADGARMLASLLARVVAQGDYEYEICLLPGPECVRPLTLSSQPGTSRRLGWDSFMPDAPGRPRRREVRYLLTPQFDGENPCP